MTYFDGLYLNKSRSACSVLGQNIDVSYGHNWLNSKEHCLARDDGPLCKQHSAVITFIWCSSIYWTRETKLNRLNNRDFPLHSLSFALLVLLVHVAFSGEPLRNLLCVTILDIILTSYSCMLSLGRTLSPPPNDAWDAKTARAAAAGPSTFWWRASQWVSLRAASY